MKTPEISVVLPARNESENLAGLLPEIASVLRNRSFEIIVVDDGSTDRTAALVDHLAATLPVRLRKHSSSLGQSACLWSGVTAAHAEIVVTLDGDGQNDPRSIAELVAPLRDPAIGIVAGQRLARKASFGKRLGAWFANGLRRALLRDGTRDTGCGAKAFRRDAFLRLPYFATMHRFLPALFLGDGWQIVHVDVVDRPRLHGRSNYGNLQRAVVGLSDLFGVWWLLRRRRRSPFRVEQQR